MLKRTLFIFMVMIIGCVFPMIVLIPAQYLGVDLSTLQGSKFVVSFTTVSIIMAYTAINIGIVYFFQVFYHRRPFSELGFRRDWLRPTIMGHLLGIALEVILVGLTMLYTGITSFKWAVPEDVSVLSIVSYYSFFLVMLFLNSLKEEVLFRSYVIETFGEYQKGKWLVIVISSILFSVIHLVLEPPTLHSFIYRFLFGVFACQLYFMTRSIWFIIGVHSGWNWIVLTFEGNWKLGGIFEMDLGDEKDLFLISVLLIVTAGTEWYSKKVSLAHEPNLRKKLEN